MPALIAAHIEMGDGAYGALAKSRYHHPRFLRAGDDGGSVRRAFLHPKDYDVALHRRKIEADPAQARQPFRQDFRVDVILDEPSEIMVERVEARGRENAGLAHRSAEHAPRPPGPHDPGVTA